MATRRANAFASMDDAHLKCRTWMHPWEPEYTFLIRTRRRLRQKRGSQGRLIDALELHLKCQRCDGMRIDTFVRGGRELIRRRYIHPEGYLVKDLDVDWGGRSLFNENVRVELISRYTKGAKKK